MTPADARPTTRLDTRHLLIARACTRDADQTSMELQTTRLDTRHLLVTRACTCDADYVCLTQRGPRPQTKNSTHTDAKRRVRRSVLDVARPSAAHEELNAYWHQETKDLTPADARPTTRLDTRHLLVARACTRDADQTSMELRTTRLDTRNLLVTRACTCDATRTTCV